MRMPRAQHRARGREGDQQQAHPLRRDESQGKRIGIRAHEELDEASDGQEGHDRPGEHRRSSKPVTQRPDDGEDHEPQQHLVEPPEW